MLQKIVFEECILSNCEGKRKSWDVLLIMIKCDPGVIELNTLLFSTRTRNFVAHTTHYGHHCGINPHHGFDSGVDNAALQPLAPEDLAY